MIDAITSGACAGAFVSLVFAFGAIRRAPHLEGKLQVLRTCTASLGTMALVVGVALMLMPRLAPPAVGGVATGATAEWLAVAREQVASLRLLGVAVAMVFAFAMLPVHYLLGELRSFVLAHRLDLAARDAATARGGRAAS